ncbi:hypothetical protein ACOSP7_020905 [Xanthoceras sorbifolium]
MHWGSWSKLCKGKEFGGMGFRDLHVFNQALLAKQTWRIISFPNSLASRVLKQCYFPTSTFLRAKHHNSSSFLWKSLLWGRNIIDLGSRWRVGDGNSVLVYSDKWILRPSTFKVVSPPVLTSSIVVGQLRNSSSYWNVPLINQLFVKDDIDFILSIPISRFRHDDVLMWHYDSNGVYSVRNGYNLAFASLYPASVSDPSNLSHWWKALWQIQLPSKIRIFLWKACHDWLPSRFNLFTRKVPVTDLCPICLKVSESTFHAFWGCKKLNFIRTAFGLLDDRTFPSTISFLDFLISIHACLSCVEFELFCVFLWRIWFRRNKWVHFSLMLSTDEVMAWSSRFLSDFRSAHKQPPSAIDSSLLPVPLARWLPHSPGVFSINSDATMREQIGKVGLRVIIRDYHGKVMACCCSCFSICCSPQVAEALAILRGLRLAEELLLLPAGLHLDALSVVNLISSSQISISKLGLLISDIMDLLNNPLFIGVSFIPRSAQILLHMI